MSGAANQAAELTLAMAGESRSAWTYHQDGIVLDPIAFIGVASRPRHSFDLHPHPAGVTSSDAAAGDLIRQLPCLVLQMTQRMLVSDQQ